MLRHCGSGRKREAEVGAPNGVAQAHGRGATVNFPHRATVSLRFDRDRQPAQNGKSSLMRLQR